MTPAESQTPTPLTVAAEWSDTLGEGMIVPADLAHRLERAIRDAAKELSATATEGPFPQDGCNCPACRTMRILFAGLEEKL